MLEQEFNLPESNNSQNLERETRLGYIRNVLGIIIAQNIFIALIVTIVCISKDLRNGLIFWIFFIEF